MNLTFKFLISVTNNEKLNKILADAEHKFKGVQQELNVKKHREEMRTKLEKEIKKASNKQEEMNKFQTEFHEYVQGGTEKMEKIYKDALKEIEDSSAEMDDRKTGKK
jgi:hypothetical protein